MSSWTGRFPKGLLQTPPERKIHRLGAHLEPKIAAALAAGPKGYVDLSPHLPDVFEQRGGSCWAHSASACGFGAHAQAGLTLAAPPSPLFFVQVYASRQRALVTPNPPFPALANDGANLADAAEIFAEWGSKAMIPPTDGVNTDVPDGPVPELDPQDLLKAYRGRFTGEYQILPDNSAPQLLMATLDANYFVWDGFQCDAACENLGPNDILGAPTGNLGGHSTLYYGYDLNTNRRSFPVDGPVFFKRNSWGRNFARGGNFLVSSTHVIESWEMWPFTLRLP